MLLMHGNESVSHHVDPELARHLTSSQTVSWHVLNFLRARFVISSGAQTLL